MSQQARRVREALNAPKVGDVELMKCSELEGLKRQLSDAIAAAQSTEYMGSPEAQKAFNDNERALWKRYNKVKAELSKRSTGP